RIWLSDVPALPRVRRKGRPSADQQLREDRPGQLGIPQLCARCFRSHRLADRSLQRRAELLPAEPRFVQGSADLGREDPGGTATFILNGAMLDKTAAWDKLEPQLKAALGERG